MSSSEPNLNPTIRSGTRADIKEITRLMTRSFARDPMENWFGDVRKLVSSADTQDKDELAIMRKESYFQEMLVRRALMVGEIDVIVIPDGKGSEKIVAVTMWLKPGAKPDPSILQYHKIRVDKVLFRGWGLKSILRVLFDYLPAVEKANKKAFAGKGKSLKDKWHLLVVATDPAHEGHGYTSLMMRKRFEQTAPLPIVLESSSPKSRDIYKHFGFEINEECEFSRGTVDEFGVRAKGEKAVGVKFWVMTKWEY